MNGKGYGMPSSHAQFTAFFSLSLTLFLLLRHNPPSPSEHPAPSTPALSHTPLTLPLRAFLSLLSLLTAVVISLSRIYLTYHTPLQVFIGFLFGLLSAVLWFGMTHWLRTEGWVEWGLETMLARSLRMRDLVVEMDLPEGGWRLWEDIRRKRATRKSR